VAVTVADTGEGIGADTLGRVFEPFFTTKEVGKGTGLGLSQVYGFVNQSGGDIRIESTPGEGTIVTMLLPAQEGEESEEEPEEDDRQARDCAGTVLIVEDEPEVRDIATEIFESLGYKVLTASDAIAALETLNRDLHIDVLFSDVVMPRGMNGLELAHE